MTTRPDQPLPNGKPLGEEQLLDWIEGRLPPAEAARLESVSGRAGLSSRVHQMQANRRALMSLGQDAAPAELHDRVMAALERDALLRGDGPIPISFADHVSEKRAPRGPRFAPGLALAAGVALLAGGAVYWGSVMLRGVGSVTPVPESTEIAKTETPAPVTASADAGAVREQDSAPAMTTALAAEEEEVVLPVGPPAPMTPERIAFLAEHGRVVLRVAGADMREMTQIEAAGSSTSGREWRLSKDLTPAAVSPVRPVRVRSSPPQIAMGSRGMVNSMASFVGPPAPASLTTGESDAPVPGAYVLETPADGLGELAAMFADKLSAKVEFEELTGHAGVTRTPDAADVLWWTQSPQNWTPRVTIPVIVERR